MLSLLMAACLSRALPPNAYFPTVPTRFHDSYVDLKDGLHVIEAWSLSDRRGSAWLAKSPFALAAYVAKVNSRAINPGPNRQGPYRWIPSDLDTRGH